MSQVNGARDLLYTRVWHHVSARDRTLGRLAEAIARVLVGKHKPFYDNSSDDRFGDVVVVTNIEDVLVTGKKEFDKLYYKSTTKPGSLRVHTFHQLRQDHPERIIRTAVSGMLPKNSLRLQRLARLKMYRGDAHPYEANLLQHHTDPVPPAQRPSALVQHLKHPDQRLIGPQPVTQALLALKQSKQN